MIGQYFGFYTLHSPRITRVLQSVSYLVPPKRNSHSYQLAEITPEMNDRTYSRLLETLQFVLDVMGCTSSGTVLSEGGSESISNLEPGGDGWKAALRVRLLHGVARRRIMERLNFSTSSYSVEDDGIPINQEDMAATYEGDFRCVCYTKSGVAGWALSVQPRFGA
jgi:hypothetical protein